MSALTRAIIRQEPRAPALTWREGLAVGPLDLPGPPGEIALAAPTPIPIFPLPRSYVTSAEPGAVPFLAVTGSPPKEKIDPAVNPVRAAAESALLQVRLVAVLPTAFVKLAIPDPFEQIRAVQLTGKFPDRIPASSPPASHCGLIFR